MTGGPLVSGQQANAADVTSRKENPADYVVWTDGTNYYGDSMIGTQDFASTNAATVLQGIFNQMGTSKHAFWVHVKSGDYNMGTVSPAVVFNTTGQSLNQSPGGFRFTGEGFGKFQQAVGYGSLQATRFLQGVNNQTLFQGSTGKNTLIQSFNIENMNLNSNGFTGGIGIDMSAAEQSGFGSVMRGITFDNTTLGTDSFSKCIVMDGNEDCSLYNINTNGTLTQGTSTVCDIQWTVQGGNVKIYDSILLTGTVPNIIKQGQTFFLGNSTINGGIKWNGAGNAGIDITEVWGLYMNNGAVPHFDTNNFTANSVKISGSLLFSSTSRVINVGTGFIDTFILENSYVKGTGAFADTAASVGRRRLHARGVKLDSGITALPSGVSSDVNSYWSPDS